VVSDERVAAGLLSTSCAAGDARRTTSAR